MTISSETRKAGPYTGNGATTAFPFAFKVFVAADLAVTLNVLATGVQTTLTLTSDYTVALNPDQNANPGGTVTYNPSGVPMPSTNTLTIGSVLTNTQGYEPTNGGAWLPSNAENAWDRAVILIQQSTEKLARSLKFPIVDGTLNPELPPAAQRANNLLSFDANGNAIAVIPSAQSAAALQAILADQVDTSNGATLIGYLGGTLRTFLDSVTTSLSGKAALAQLAASAGASIIGWIQSGTGTGLRTVQDKLRDTVSILDFTGADPTGATSSQVAFDAAAAYSVLSGKPIEVTPGTWTLTADISNAAAWIIQNGANISKLVVPSSIGSGGGNLTFNKSRLTAAELYGDEEIETFSAGYGRNILPNPYFAVWPDLDAFGGTSVTATRPTMGDAATYSGTGGKRIYGPAGWWGKVWGGAFDAADPLNFAGGGTVTLERKQYGTTGEVNETPYYMRWSLSGYNSVQTEYQDPVQPSGLRVGTASAEIACIVRGARRYGKFTYKLRARWLSGDNHINVRLLYSFGTGGSPSPNAQINMQGFDLDNSATNIISDYVCMFEAPEFTVDANGDAIVFGSNADDYIQLTISVGSGNFSYDVFANELRPGWGFADFEYRPLYLERMRAQEDYRILKVGYFGPTTNGVSAGQVVGFQPPMHDVPTITFHDVVFNASSAMRMGISDITLTSNGYGYTSAPTVTISGGGGSGATATAALGVVSFAKVTAAGTGYTSAPTVSFTGGGGSGAAGTAVLNSSGGVAYINMTNNGTGYTTVPTVGFSGGGGSGATATGYLGIESIAVTAAGSAYTSVPTVSFSGGSGAGASGTAVLDPTAVSIDQNGYLSGAVAALTATGSRFIGKAIANGRRVKT